MKFTKLLIAFLILFFFCVLWKFRQQSFFPPQNPSFVSSQVDNFSLVDHAGKFHELYYYSDKKAIVIISQGNGCPIIRQSLPYIKQLSDQYEPLGVVFFMINANPQDSWAAIADEAKAYGIDIPILEDKSQVIARSLNLTRTAEAIVINPRNWNKVYQGAVSDQWGYAAQKTEAGHQYIKEAIDALLQGKLIPVSTAPVKGCLINFEDHLKKYSYAEDAAPILIQKCLPCHSPGGGAPWIMDNYAKVKGWGTMMREVIRIQRMPPWHASSHYLKLKNDLSLKPEEVRALIGWIEQGFLKGKGEDPLAVIEHKSENSDWPLGQPDLVFTVKETQHIPATGPDLFVIMEVDPIVENDLWIRAVDLRPSNFNVAHHGNVSVYFSEQDNVADIPEEKKDWYIQSGINMDTGKVIAGYAPGSGPFVLPEDTGMFIPRGARLSLLMHYVITGKEETDLPKLGLYLYKTKSSHVLSVEKILNRDINIPAGARDYRLDGSYQFHEDVTLVAVTPHMHYRGRSMEIYVEYPDGRSEEIFSAPNYKFRWQRQYVFDVPKKIPAGSRIIARGIYDNSAQNEDNPDPAKNVSYGPGNNDEMFLAVLYYIREK